MTPDESIIELPPRDIDLLTWLEENSSEVYIVTRPEDNPDSLPF